MEARLFEKYGLVVDAGKILFQEGEVGDKMFIIQEGNVRISKNIGGKEHILAVLGKGDFFGEMAIVTKVKRTATATAAGTVRLLVFNREGFINMIEKNARIALNVIDKLCRRLQQANMQIQNLVKRNEKGLIASNLYYAFAEVGFEVGKVEYHKLVRDLSLSLELPQDDILACIDQVKTTGVVTLEDNALVLRDKDRLAEIAEIPVSQS
jgi:CRP/FNR family transcriptional regulator, cyclic AMP receptor protein